MKNSHGVSGVMAALTLTGVLWSCAPRTTTTPSANDQMSSTPGQTSTPTPQPGPPTTYDVDALGVPSIIAADYIELDKIDRVSLFRSGVGHDYSDGVETCRTMKHYFMPKANVDWAAVVISSPLPGTIARMENETTFGTQIQIASAVLPAATVILFHVVPDAAVVVGATVAAGQRLGHHVGSQTMSDVAIRVMSPSGMRLVSYAEAMDDQTFARYAARGVPSRAALTISRPARDAASLTCQGEAFTNSGSLEHWAMLE